jgi:hypothetical protein
MIYRFEFIFDIDTYNIKQAYELITADILKNNYVEEWKQGAEYFYQIELHNDGVMHRHHYIDNNNVVLNFVVGEFGATKLYEIDRLFKLCCSYTLITNVYELSSDEFINYKQTHPYVIEQSNTFAKYWEELYYRDTGEQWYPNKKISKKY